MDAGVCYGPVDLSHREYVLFYGPTLNIQSV